MFENNKKFLFIAGGAFVVFVIIVVLLFTIGSGGKKKIEETTLTFWNLSDEKEVFDRTIIDFQAENPNVKINYVKKDDKDYLNDVLNEIASGRGPDILAMPNDWLPKYHDKLIALPTNKISNRKEKKNDFEVYRETYPQVVSTDNIINNQIYGMPLSIDTLTLYYNRNLFQDVYDEYRKANPGSIDGNLQKSFTKGPSNWDDFSRLAMTISKRSGENVTTSAISLGTADNVNQAVDILTLLMLQNGAKMTSDDLTSAQLQTNYTKFGNVAYPGANALEFYTNFAKVQNDHYNWNGSMPDSLHAFAEGKTAMMIDYLSQEDAIKRINPNLNFGTFSIPQVEETENPINYASYLTYTVTRASKNTDLAWNFILSFTSRENSNSYISSTSKPPARLDAVQKTDPAYTAQGWYKPDPVKADEIFNKMIKEVNSGQNPQTAIEGAASEITTLLQKLLP